MSQCRVLPGPKAYSNVNRLPNDVRVKVSNSVLQVLLIIEPLSHFLRTNDRGFVRSRLPPAHHPYHQGHQRRKKGMPSRRSKFRKQATRLGTGSWLAFWIYLGTCLAWTPEAFASQMHSYSVHISCTPCSTEPFGLTLTGCCCFPLGLVP